MPRARRSEPVELQGAVEFARTRLQFEPDERQAEVLASTARRGILNCTRQWGKSTVTAAKAIHRAYTQAEILVVVASPSERQSGEWMLKAERLTLPNGSRIVGLPGRDDKIGGPSEFSLLPIDEAAPVTESLYSR